MAALRLLAVSALAVAATGCGPKTPPVRSALDCPPAEGDLTRTSVAADGKTCTYVTGDGAGVTLQLVALRGGLDATLSGIETVLLAHRGAAKAETTPAAERERDDTTSDADRAVREAETDAGDAAHLAGRDAEDGDDTAGAQISTGNDGETRIILPGIHIVANDRDDTAHVRVGPLSVNVGGDNAVIRVRRDVRLQGEVLNPERRGVRATFLYAGDDLPDGYRYVGYEAGGPKGGPITVAVVKSKSSREDGDAVYAAIRQLVRRNGGV